jgi:hypothetical protein
MRRPEPEAERLRHELRRAGWVYLTTFTGCPGRGSAPPA